MVLADVTKLHVTLRLIFGLFLFASSAFSAHAGSPVMGVPEVGMDVQMASARASTPSDTSARLAALIGTAMEHCDGEHDHNSHHGLGTADCCVATCYSYDAVEVAFRKSFRIAIPLDFFSISHVADGGKPDTPERPPEA